MSEPRPRARLVETAVLLAALTAVACARVKYPRCAQDADCAGHGEVCIQGQCQECRGDSDCEARHPREGRTCRAGRCEAKEGCQSHADCRAKGPGLVCHAGACVVGCAGDDDCGAGSRCQSGTCRPGCRSDQDCAGGEACVEGACRPGAGGGRGGPLSTACRPDGAVPGQVVRLDPVRFAFNKFDLSAEVQAQLQQAVSCLREAPAGLQVVVEGHCDDRGTQEYNLALGQKRAQSVVDHMVRLGADAKALLARSKGENEPTCSTAEETCFAQNRRVEFIQSLGGQL